MTKDPLIFIEHILECIELIENYLNRFKKYDFYEEQWLQDMIVRRVQILGEAAKNVPQSIQKKYSDVSWQNIVGTRNILVHAYDNIDLTVVWDIVQKDLIPLKKQIIQIKKNLQKS